VRFEELVDIGPQLLERMARFLDHRGEIVPWRNPLDQLARAEPGLFQGGGSKQFGSTPIGRRWWMRLQLLPRRAHGALGYGSASVGEPPPDQRALFDWDARAGAPQPRAHEHLATSGLRSIHRLHDEARAAWTSFNALSASQPQ
jgi:hypothetical protein